MRGCADHHRRERAERHSCENERQERSRDFGARVALAEEPNALPFRNPGHEDERNQQPPCGEGRVIERKGDCYDDADDPQNEAPRKRQRPEFCKKLGEPLAYPSKGV